MINLTINEKGRANNIQRAMVGMMMFCSLAR